MGDPFSEEFAAAPFGLDDGGTQSLPWLEVVSDERQAFCQEIQTTRVGGVVKTRSDRGLG